MTKCIAPSCDEEAKIGSALCGRHTDWLQKAEKEHLKNSTRAIHIQLRQFDRLRLQTDPILSPEEIAHRMVWPVERVRYWLKKFKDDEYRGHATGTDTV